jgi:Gly-Xaa carboxypeptidase
MGHQDVVPVLEATESRWTYSPYSAHYDGRYIWGRGATDCKNVVIGVLEAFETLLSKGYTPERTMMAGFGFDEEISGFQGALYIAKHLEETKGKDSLDLIIDEGGLGIKEMYGAMFVLPGVGEKGMCFETFGDSVFTISQDIMTSKSPLRQQEVTLLFHRITRALASSLKSLMR